MKTLKTTIVELNKRLIALESVSIHLCYDNVICVCVVTVSREEW